MFTKVRLLYTVVFLDLFACSLYIPLLSGHLRSLGASHLTIGILSSLYAGLQLLSSPIIGSWSDIRGCCCVLEVTLICCCGLYCILGTATAVPLIVLCRIGLGMMKHTQTLCRTMLTDVVPSGDQPAVVGRLVSYGAVGFILGPAIGGHMAELDGGFRYVCYLVMLFFFINFAIAHFFLSSSSHSHEESKEKREKISAGTEAIKKVQETLKEVEKNPDSLEFKTPAQRKNNMANNALFAESNSSVKTRSSKSIVSSYNGSDTNISSFSAADGNDSGNESSFNTDEEIRCSLGGTNYNVPSDSGTQLRTTSIKSDIFLAVKNLSEVNWSVYWDVFALKFLLGFALAIHYQNFGIILREVYEITPKWIGYIISLQALVGAIAGFGMGRISKWYKSDDDNFLRILHGFGVLMLTFIFLPFAPSITFVILCLLPQSAAGSLLRITTSEVLLERTTSSQRGSLIGSAQSMSSIARFVAPLCSGLVYDIFGFEGLSLLKVAIPGTAMVLTSFWFQRTKHNKQD